MVKLKSKRNFLPLWVFRPLRNSGRLKFGIFGRFRVFGRFGAGNIFGILGRFGIFDRNGFGIFGHHFGSFRLHALRATQDAHMGRKSVYLKPEKQNWTVSDRKAKKNLCFNLAALCKPAQHHATPCNLVRPRATPCNPVRPCATPCNPVQPRAIPCSPVRAYAA